MYSVYPVFVKSQLVDFNVLQSFALCVIMQMNGGFTMITYKKATLEDLDVLWDKEIETNHNDPRYVRWKGSFLERNRSGRAATFLIYDEKNAIGQVTLDRFADSYSGNRDPLADGFNTAYVTALRIDKEHERKGYVSRLMHFMEKWAKEQGVTRLTIGVEAAESRNLAIYLHWGYTEFVMAEEDGGELVLFYAKKL